MKGRHSVKFKRRILNKNHLPYPFAEGFRAHPVSYDNRYRKAFDPGKIDPLPAENAYSRMINPCEREPDCKDSGRYQLLALHA